MDRIRCIRVPCYRPLAGFRGRVRGRSGNRPIVFSAADGFVDLPVKVPCGQCVGCRLERSRQWAMRIMHEASLHDDNAFITLTYDDEHLPRNGSLDRRAFPLFMKRLRRLVEPKRLRYYHCGEYGTDSGRAHYHSIIFGFGFDDRRPWAVRKGNQSWRSPTLEKAWPFGHAEIGAVTFESAAYVARYVVKKVTGKAAEDHYARVDEETGELFHIEPEYATMSRRPGIGADWLDKFGGETYRDDSVVMRGREMRPPRYYDVKYGEVDAAAVSRVKELRQAKRVLADESDVRLAVREKCAQARLSLKSRGL